VKAVDFFAIETISLPGRLHILLVNYFVGILYFL